jgi:hypothetical protein
VGVSERHLLQRYSPSPVSVPVPMAKTAPSACRLIVNRGHDHENGLEDGESEPQSWMPLLISRHQQESTL